MMIDDEWYAMTTGQINTLQLLSARCSRRHATTIYRSSVAVTGNYRRDQASVMSDEEH